MEKKAAAIGYTGAEQVPKILALARGILVEKMLEIADTYNITVYHDSDLAETLSALPVGIEIPGELYKSVAEVLTYCYKVNAEFREKLNKKKS